MGIRAPIYIGFLNVAYCQCEKFNLYRLEKMIAQEIMASVDQNGQLCLDTPLILHKHSRVKVIVLFIEDEIDDDDESKESILESLKTSLQEVKAGKVRPVSELWEGIDDE
jgi:Zn-finger protein